MSKRLRSGDPANDGRALVRVASEGIQPSIVQDIARVGIELNRSDGLTIVLAEQNIDMIRAMAQRCYVMDKGRIVAELTPEMLEDRDTVRRYLAV